MKKPRIVPFLYILSSVFILGSCSDSKQSDIKGDIEQPDSSDIVVAIEPIETEIPDEIERCYPCKIDELVQSKSDVEYLKSEDHYPTLSWEEYLSIDGIKLLQAGNGYHGNEVYLDYGTHQMMAVVKNNDSYSVVPTSVNIIQVEDLIVDDGNGNKSGKDIVPDVENVVFLVEGVDLQHTSNNFHGHNGSYKTDSTLKAGTMALGDYQFGFFTHLVEDATLDYSPFKRLFFYVTDGISSDLILDNYWDNAEVMPVFIWAGDLDGDSKPDFLLDCSDHYNVSNIVLFLSSKAKPGRLSEAVAQFRTTGC